MSNLKGVPKKVILLSNEQAYPSDLIAYADLLIRDGRIVKDRHGKANRSATSQELADAKPLSPEEAKLALDEAAWRGETPADGTRRRVIFDTLLAPDVLSDTEALDFADSIESVLSRLDIGADPYRETSPASEAMKVLDSMEIDQTRGGRILDIGERVTELADELVAVRRERDRLDQARYLVEPKLASEVGRSAREVDAEKLTAELAEGAGWKGTPPAEGTRRALIRDAIGEHYERTGEYAASDRPELALMVADAVESALLRSTIDDEAMVRGAEALTAGIVDVDVEAGSSTKLPEGMPEGLRHSERELWLRGDGDVRVLLDRISRLRSDEDLELLLEQRESARAGEDHWKAQRDAAFRLLQWVLPDLMGHPSDTLGADLADDAPEEDREAAPDVPDHFALSEQARAALAARIEEGRIDADDLIEIARLG